VKLAYIIRAHMAPEQLARLVRRLDRPDAAFYIHVNGRTDDSVFAEMRSALSGKDNVTWLPRLDCYWAGFSLVRATLRGIDAILADGTPPDYALLLTGQDYPLRPTIEIEDFLRRHAGSNFLHHFRLPNAGWAYENGGLNRIRYVYFERIRFRNICFGCLWCSAVSLPGSSRTEGWRSGR
jgi:hypothetical protein